MERNILNFDKKIGNAKSHFGTILLTLVSIVVGVSLEHLLGKIFEHPLSYYSIKYWAALYGINSFFILFIIWFDYLWAILFFHWKIRFRDSFILFLIIVPQIYSFNNLENPSNWMIAAIITGLLGIIAYHNTYQNINTATFKFDNKSDKNLNTQIKNFVLKHQQFCKGCILITALISLIFLLFVKQEIIGRIIYPLFIFLFFISKIYFSARFVKMIYMKDAEVLSLINLFSFKKLN